MLDDRGQVIVQAGCLDELRAALDALWKCRRNREQQFGDLVNHLQGLLLDVDGLPTEQIRAIAHVIDKAACASCLTDADLREYTKILMRAGCDVFREIW